MLLFQAVLWLISPPVLLTLPADFSFFYQAYFKCEICSWSVSLFLALKTLLNLVFYIELCSWEALDERSQRFVIILQIYKLEAFAYIFLTIPLHITLADSGEILRSQFPSGKEQALLSAFYLALILLSHERLMMVIGPKNWGICLPVWRSWGFDEVFSLTPKYIASETLPGHFVSFIVNRCFRLPLWSLAWSNQWLPCGKGRQPILDRHLM